MDPGLLSRNLQRTPGRVENTGLPGRGEVTVKGWRFHGAGAPSFPPKIYTAELPRYRGNLLKQMAHSCLIHTKRIGTWHLELDVTCWPCPAISAFWVCFLVCKMGLTPPYCYANRALPSALSSFSRRGSRKPAGTQCAQTMTMTSSHPPVLFLTVHLSVSKGPVTLPLAPSPLTS